MIFRGETAITVHATGHAATPVVSRLLHMNEDDPTKVRNQPALTTSHGLEWLVIGGISAVVCIGMLLLQLSTDAAVAIGGAVVVAALYLAMIVVRFAVRRLRVRLAALAVLLGVMLVVTIAALFVVVLG